MNDTTQRHWLIATVIAGLLTLGPMAVRGDDADDARDADEDLAKQGWVVDSLHLEGGDQPGVRHFVAKGRIRLPVEPVWQAMANQNDQDWPGLNDVVREYINGDTLISRYKLGVPIYSDRKYRLRIINDHPTRTMYFEQIPGYGNVNEIKGRWSASGLVRHAVVGDLRGLHRPGREVDSRIHHQLGDQTGDPPRLRAPLQGRPESHGAHCGQEQRLGDTLREHLRHRREIAST